VRLDLRIPLAGDIRTTSEFIAACESAGFDGAAVHEHPESGQDPFVSVADALSHTRSISVYVAVTNIATRHPLVLASLSNSLADLSNGRFRLVLGVGDGAVREVGRPPTRLADLTAGIQSIVNALDGRDVSFGAAPVKLATVLDSRPEVFLACAGRHGLEAAVNCADGAFLSAPITSDVEATISGLIPQGFRVIRVLPLCLTDSDDEGLVAFTSWWQATESGPERGGGWLVGSTMRWLGRVGSSLRAELRSASGNERRRIADSIGLFGSPEYCRARIEELERQGIEHIYLRPIGVEMPGRKSSPSRYPLLELTELAPARLQLVDRPTDKTVTS